MGCKAVECEFNIERIEGCALLGFFPEAHLKEGGKCVYYKEKNIAAEARRRGGLTANNANRRE